MQKRIHTILIVAMMLLIIAACGGASTNQIGRAASSSYNPYLVLVNKTNRLPDDWEEVVQIDEVENSLGESHRIEQKTFAAYTALREELLDQGIQIELDSVYRSVDEQIELWDYFTEKYGEEYTRAYVATPGYSEHHTGLAVDIFLIKNGEEIRENDDMIAEREDFAKIHELLPKYGFILRYPEGKKDITGYGYEPWHFRYVDDPEIAATITDEHLTLEEYLSR